MGRVDRSTGAETHFTPQELAAHAVLTCEEHQKGGFGNIAARAKDLVRGRSKARGKPKVRGRS